MSEPRLCCNCLHCARWKKENGIECHCDLNDKYLDYLTVMDEENDCKHWEKETKWDLQREHDAKVRAKAIDEFVTYYKLNPCPPDRDDCDCTIEEYACLECMANYFKRRKKNDNNGTN